MEMLRPRTDSLGEIFRFCRCHHENDFVGRLFQKSKQRVRSLVGQHVGFVEDHNFVAPARGRVADHFAQLADLVDAAIGRCVDLDHIE